MTLIGVVGGVFTAAAVAYCGWLSLSCLLRCPALWVEEGDLVWLSPVPSRLPLNAVASYKFQSLRTGERVSIRGVRLFMRDGRKVFVPLHMLDGSEAVVACLRRHVPHAGSVAGNLGRAAVI